MQQLKAIDTKYNGYMFRSRLEARWAVFFDTLGIPYDYEPEGFDLDDAGWYLPDFWLPKLGCWVEIKPVQPSSAELYKASELARLSNQQVVVLFGQIRCPELEYVDGFWLGVRSSSYEGIGYYGSTDNVFCEDMGGWTWNLEITTDFLLSEGVDCPHFDGTMTSAWGIKAAHRKWEEENHCTDCRYPLGWCCPRLFWNFDGDYRLKANQPMCDGWLGGQLVQAYVAAQRARF